MQQIDAWIDGLFSLWIGERMRLNQYDLFWLLEVVRGSMFGSGLINGVQILGRILLNRWRRGSLIMSARISLLKGLRGSQENS